ncbi:hypothetical protein [uncultured Methanobrevibacter sp.]|uniref:hypothetical protein n=1 Tax=uncultured Methanobrevibacter sp. TaxID=253161 RepID=UPI002620BC0F|nr:hypothetical protein [uncultured Methanobrevibacter sp.]
MNGITILLWIAIFVIGAVAAVGVKRHYGNAELGKDDKPSLSKENKKGLFSFGNKNDSDKNRLSQPNLNYTTQEAPKDNYPAEEIKTSTPQNIEYESPNQVLIDYENEVKKFHEPMTQNQIDIMTSNNEQNEKHELKDLFTIDELIKESKRKDSEREKESQKIETKAEDTTEIKESILKKQENDEVEEKLIEEILADDEISELLNAEAEEESGESIQDIIDSAESKVETVEETKEETIQDIIDSAEAKEETAEETKEETIQDIIDSTEAKEETIQDIIDNVEAEKESVQDVLDVEETPEVPEPATQKDIAEAITNASQEIEEEKEDEIGFSESEGITDAVLNSEEEIKQPTLKSPTKIDEIKEPNDDTNLYTPKQEENELDYRKDLAKITNTIRGSRLFQDVKEKIRPSEPETEPIADLEENYIRTVNDYEDAYVDEYEPIINETHDEFGEEYEPFYDEDAIREENTRRLMKTVERVPEPEVAKPVIETIKPKPARENIKIKMGNADMVLKKGDEIIFKHDGETYSSQVYAINGDDISVRYRRKDIIIKPEDVKKIY